MLANRGYAAYANNKVMTASPAELTLMLYEGAIKFANIAIEAIAFDKQLKSVDLPTFGSPTIPHCNAIYLFRFYLVIDNLTAKIGIFRLYTLVGKQILLSYIYLMSEGCRFQASL